MKHDTSKQYSPSASHVLTHGDVDEIARLRCWRPSGQHFAAPEGWDGMVHHSPLIHASAPADMQDESPDSTCDRHGRP